MTAEVFGSEPNEPSADVTMAEEPSAHAEGEKYNRLMLNRFLISYALFLCHYCCHTGRKSKSKH